MYLFIHSFALHSLVYLFNDLFTLHLSIHSIIYSILQPCSTEKYSLVYFFDFSDLSLYFSLHSLVYPYFRLVSVRNQQRTIPLPERRREKIGETMLIRNRSRQPCPRSTVESLSTNFAYKYKSVTPAPAQPLCFRFPCTSP